MSDTNVDPREHWDCHIPEGEELPTLNPSEEWVNYGDANPDTCGGKWVRFDGMEMWHIVETIPWAEIDPSVETLESGGHYLMEHWIELQDLFTDGDMAKGPTDDMRSILETFGDSDSGLLSAIREDRIEYYVADFTHYLHDHRQETISHEEYWEILEGRYGITEA